MPTTRVIFGCGYLGLRVGKLWSSAGDRTIAVTRSEHRTGEFAAAGLVAAIGDVTQASTLAWLAEPRDAEADDVESVVFAVGYDRTAGPDIHAVYAHGLANVLAAAPPTVERVVYISTTGVYGSAGGEWVDETTPPDPQRDGGRASLAAEQVLAAHRLGRRSAILRLAGLYGPGRVPYLDQLRAGEPLPVPSEGWLNLIHVDDAAAIVVAVDRWLADQPTAPAPQVFCVSDGAPVRRGDYYSEAARLVGAPPPRFATPAADSPAAARATANRRVRNDKLFCTLGVALRYPTHREGLAAILNADRS